MSGIDRQEILRIDCPTCFGNGYTGQGPSETMCNACGGSGMLERSVPFKFDGKRSKEEIATAFGLPVGQIRDTGHSAGDEK